MAGSLVTATRKIPGKLLLALAGDLPNQSNDCASRWLGYASAGAATHLTVGDTSRLGTISR
jgi:hypothetical protein